jgi:hypothetical protein
LTAPASDLALSSRPLRSSFRNPGRIVVKLTGSSSHELLLPYRVLPETQPLPMAPSKPAVLTALHSHKLPEGNLLGCRQSPLLGSQSLFATSTMRVHLTRAFPKARYVPPTGFLSLSAVCSSQRFAALFHAATAYRVSLFRAFPSQAAAVSRRNGLALLALAAALRRCLSKLRRPWNAVARLQGFDPLGNPSPLLCG